MEDRQLEAVLFKIVHSFFTKPSIIICMWTSAILYMLFAIFGAEADSVLTEQILL